MKNRILAMLMAAVLCLGAAAVTVPAGQAFSDVSGDVAEAVEVLSGLGIVSGYSDGGYHPGDSLTRAQFCKLAVLAEGHGDQVKNSAYKTLFSDVPATGWAAPYVNLAYEEGMVAGYGNGLFGPDDAVSCGQAVTIVLRLLGYTTADVGPFWPEDYMAKGTELGLLSGIGKSAGEGLTRGEAALLLYRALKADTTQGRALYEGLAAATVENAVLLDTSATAGDGTADTVKIYADGAVSYYVKANESSAALAGTRGTLLLNRSGAAAGFLPEDGAVRTLTVAAVDAAGIQDANGNTFSLTNGLAVLLDDEKQTWADCWYDIRKGDTVTVFYSAAGTVDLLWVRARAAVAGSTITGYYEDASPNTTAPGTITVLGAVLTVPEDGAEGLSDAALGDKITVTLDGSGEVAAVSPASSAARMVGVLKSGGASPQVELTGGVTVSGKSTGAVSAELVGSLVKVSSSAAGKISVSGLSYSGASAALDVKNGTLGDRALAEQVKIYERVGTSPVTEITLDDILVDTVAAASIEYVGTGADGAVDLLVLSDVTGACYDYGILEKGEQSGGSGEMKYTNTTVQVENGNQGNTAYITGISFRDGAVGGVAGTAAGKAAKVITLTELEGITRADFDGGDSVAGIPISGDVQVYNAATGKWTTLSAAKAFTDDFAVYYDRTPETGGQVRVIFAL